MKKVASIIIVFLVAGLGLIAVHRVNAQTDIERVEKEIRGLEALAGMCTGARFLLMPPGPNASPEDRAAFNETLATIETCAANIKSRLDWLRKKLGELQSRLPSATGPEEDPKRKKQREKIKEWEQRLAAAEAKATQISTWLENLNKTIKRWQPKPGYTAENNSAERLSTTTLTTPEGRIFVYLPDDIRAGEKISGTVVAEPTGQTEAERQKNLAALGAYVITVDPLTKPSAAVRLPVAKSNNFVVNLPPDSDGGAPMLHVTITQTKTDDPPPEPALVILLDHARSGAASDALVDDELDLPAKPTPPKTSKPNDFHLPTIGQNGRSVRIKGPFDGDSTTTFLTIGGQPVVPLVESPRSCIFKSPETNFGPTEIVIKENGVETKGIYRNLSVRLSALKTNLLKGENTIITIIVEGLKGILENIPLLLEKKGDVSLEGGDVQTIQIRPNDVVIEGAQGKFEIRKAVVGLRPGVFNITATVIDPRVRPIIIPLFENGGVNGYRVKKDGAGFVINVENVKHPITGDPVDGQHKLEHKCPDLKKLPYVQTLFLNKGVGRGKSECLIMMTTPRIILDDQN
jgi:hypothetical protein